MNYPALTGKASRFIETLTCGMFAFHRRRGVSSLGVSPAFHRQSPFGHQ
ncbi:MAG: hypothetical protein RXP28_01155 [Nitrososphaeria archaeon]